MNLTDLVRAVYGNSLNWVCPRCGTTNNNWLTRCQECNNQRP